MEKRQKRQKRQRTKENKILRRRRQELGLSTHDAANAVGVCWLTYWRWEKAKQVPHRSSMKLLIKAFDVKRPEDLGFPPFS